MTTDSTSKEEVFYNDGRERLLHEYVFSHSGREKTLRNNPLAIVDSIEDFAQSEFIMTFKRAKIEKARLLLASLDPPPKVLVELGTYVGNSAIAWGEILRSVNGGQTQGLHVFAVEPEVDFVQIAQDFVELAGLADIVTVVKGFSGDFLKTLKTDHGIDKIDVLFMDHWESAYLPDLHLIEDLGLFHEGSLILADNTDVPGAPEYLRYVRSEEKTVSGFRYETRTVDSQGKAGDPTTIEVSLVTEVV